MPNKKINAKETITKNTTKVDIKKSEKSDNKKSESKESKNEESENEESESEESESEESESEESESKETESKKSTSSVKKITNNKKVEDNDSESSESSENSDDESDEDDVKVVSTSKEKKPKKSWEEIVIEWEKLNSDLKENESKHKELVEAVRKNEKLRNDLERQRNRIYATFITSHKDEVKRISKLKPKRRSNTKSGFNMETPVPSKLIQYLELEAGVHMARPQVMHLLNEKFKKDGLKNGQITTLDKNAAQVLGKEKNREIKFTGFQQFLKEIYDEDKNISNTKE